MDQFAQAIGQKRTGVLSKVWDLPESIQRRLGDRSGRQRAMVEDGHLLLILHKVPEGGRPEREGAYFWRKPDGTWECTGRGGGLGTLRTHVDAYRQRVDELDEQYARAQDAADYFRLLEVLGPLSRAASNLRAALQTARDGISDDRDIIDLRDAAYDVSRAAELLHMDTKNALEYQIARQAQEQARAGREMAEIGHKLNLLAAIFFPLTAITSVFGMTLQSGLEEFPPWLFWTIFAAGLCLGFLIHNRLTTKKDSPRRPELPQSGG